MARRGKKHHRARSFLSPGNLMKFVRVGALVAPAAYCFMKEPEWSNKIGRSISLYTGYSVYDGKFRFEDLLRGWTPFVATSLVTYGIQKLSGVIRRI